MCFRQHLGGTEQVQVIVIVDRLASIISYFKNEAQCHL